MINPKNKQTAGFGAMQVVIVVGVVAVLALLFFGLPGGVKDFFAKLKGGTASISSFGDFQKDANNNISIDSVADTMVKDLMSVQTMAKAETGDKKDGICFKNPAAETDFYNIVSNISGTDACDSAASIVNVVSLPSGISIVDPATGSNKSIVFQKDGTSVASTDQTIKIASSTETRIVTVTPSGNATFSVGAPSTASAGASSGSGGTTTIIRTVTADNTGQINALSNVANGLANVLGSIRTLQNQNTVVTVPVPVQVPVPVNVTSGAPSQPSNLYAQGSYGYIALNWTVSAGAISTYKIYRSQYPGQESFLASVGAINYYADYSVAAGSTYYYKVTAVNTAGQESPLSNEAYSAAYVQSPVTYYTPVPVPAPVPQQPQIFQPSVPTIVSAAYYPGNGVVLNWLAPQSNGNSYIVGYRVYRNISVVNSSLIYDSTSQSTTYTDSSLAPNTNYCYQISAKNQQYESPRSAAQCVYTYVAQTPSPTPSPSPAPQTPTYYSPYPSSTPPATYYYTPGTSTNQTPTYYSPTSYSNQPATYYTTSGSSTPAATYYTTAPNGTQAATYYTTSGSGTPSATYYTTSSTSGTPLGTYYATSGSTSGTPSATYYTTSGSSTQAGTYYGTQTSTTPGATYYTTSGSTSSSPATYYSTGSTATPSATYYSTASGSGTPSATYYTTSGSSTPAGTYYTTAPSGTQAATYYSSSSTPSATYYP